MSAAVGTKKTKRHGKFKKPGVIKALTTAQDAYHHVAEDILGDATTHKILFENKCFSYIRVGNVAALTKLINTYKHHYNDFTLDFKDKLTGNTPVIVAAYHGKLKTLKLLLDNGADPTLQNNSKETVLSYSSKAIQSVLINMKTKELWLASWKGDVELVRSLLQDAKNGLDIEISNRDGLTPLLLVTRDINKFEQIGQMKNYQPFSVVKELLKHKASPLRSDSDGKTPLHYIAANNGTNAGNIANVLISEIGDTNMTDSQDSRPLHVACSSGSLAVADALLRAGADVNSQDHNGKTPLHLTCASGDERIISLLLLHNPNMDIHDVTGSLPIDLAKTERIRSLVKGLPLSKNDDDVSVIYDRSLPSIQRPKARSKSDPTKYKCVAKPKLKRKERSLTENRVQGDKNDKGFIDAHLRALQETVLPHATKSQSTLSDVDSPRSNGHSSDTEMGVRHVSRRPKLEPLVSEAHTIQRQGGVRKRQEGETTDHTSSSSNAQSDFNKKQVLPDITNPSPVPSDSESKEQHASTETECSLEERYHHQQRAFVKERAKTFAGNFSRKKEIVTGKSGIPFHCLLDEVELPPEQEKLVSTPARNKTPIFIPFENGYQKHTRKLKAAKKEVTPLQRLTEDDKNLTEDDKNRTFTKEDKDVVRAVREKLASTDKTLIETMENEFRVAKLAVRRVISDSALAESGSLGLACKHKMVRLSHVHSSSDIKLHSPSPAPPRRLSRSLSPTASLQAGDCDFLSCPKSKPVEAFSLTKEECKITTDCDEKDSAFLVLQSKELVKKDDLCHCPRELKVHRNSAPATPQSPHRGIIPVSPQLKRRRAVLAHHNSSNDIPLRSTSPKHEERTPRDNKRETSLKQFYFNGAYKLITSSIDIFDDDFGSSSDDYLSPFEDDHPIMMINHTGNDNNYASKKLLIKSLRRKARSEKREEINSNGCLLKGRGAHSSPKHDLHVEGVSSTIFDPKTKIDHDRPSINDAHDNATDIHDIAEGPRITDSKRTTESLVLESINCDGGNILPHSEFGNPPLEASKGRVAEELGNANSDEKSIHAEKANDAETGAGSEPCAGPGMGADAENFGDDEEDDDATQSVSKNDGEFSDLADLLFSPNLVNSDLQVAGFSRQGSSKGSSNTLTSCNDVFQRFDSVAESLDSDDEEEDFDFQLGNLLGKGAYGHVYLGLTQKGTMIAVKQVPVGNICDRKAAKQYASLKSEVNVLKCLNHKNIVRFLGTRYVEGTVSIMMEYLPGGSIASVLSRFGPLTESVVKRYTRQILCGVAYLHENGIVHRDIKGGNVMVMQTGIVKLIDFGCARRLNLNLTNTSLLKSVKGTPYWMSPEVIQGTGHDFKSDVWSAGCTVFEMANGKPPWSHLSMYAAMFAIASEDKELPEMPQGLSSVGQDFIRSCMIRDPSQRPTSCEILNHQFLLKRSSLSTFGIEDHLPDNSKTGQSSSPS